LKNPRIEINLEKIAHNCKKLISIYGLNDINIFAVTKVVCGRPRIAQVLVKSGINTLADSRLENIIRMSKQDIRAEFLLTRSPQLSEVINVIKYTDISLNSELSVIRALSESALKHKTIHKVILMIELGDLREGIMPSEIEQFVHQVLKFEGIKLHGIGTNLACFGGILPDNDKMQELSDIANRIEEKFNLSLEVISGGNSANYNWFKSTKNIGRINHLRIGESIFLGLETLNREPIPDLFTDAFTLIAEVIESKIKPSVPYGQTGQNAFGETPVFQESGNIHRIILAIGLQDVVVSGLIPKLDIQIIGSSSDHLIIDSGNVNLKVGDTVEFNLNYSCLLSAMTSPYVSKKYKKPMNAQEYCELVEQNEKQQEHKRKTFQIQDNHSPLVSLKNSKFSLMFEPSIKKDYQYYVREEIFEKIGRISKKLENDHKQLIIRSVWRSFDHQRLIWENKVTFLREKHPEKTIAEIEKIVSYFIAPPTKSMHSTGGSVDALIYDLTSNSVMDFGTNDGLKIDLNDQCYPFHPDLSKKVKANRKLLIDLFEDEDFVVDYTEYWHFDYGNVNWAIRKEKEHSIYGIIESN
jgi:predicted amino acid racemase/D-alanyl-D-alanine dipeptidase